MKHISEWLNEAVKELYEERAAIMHYDGGLPIEKAEALARAEAETYQAHLEQVHLERRSSEEAGQA